MSDNSSIEWTGASWTPIKARNIATGKVGWFCEHMSHGCDNCYAEKMNVNTYFGNGLPYKASSLPQLELFLDEKMLEKPLHWRKARKIFVCSMTDLFGRFVPDEDIRRIFAVMMCAPQHIFQVLTKRPERMARFFKENSPNDCYVEAVTEIRRANDFSRLVAGLRVKDLCGVLPDSWPLSNVWLGISCEDQKTADERIPLLLQAPAAVRWISAEPLLGPVDLNPIYDYGGIAGHEDVKRRAYYAHLDWVVCGGESGIGARLCDISNIRSIVEQCKAAGIPVFVKQLGSKPFMGVKGFGPVIRDRKGGDIDEFPDDLKIRQFPSTSALRGE